jgi:hypothetical protein
MDTAPEPASPDPTDDFLKNETAVPHAQDGRCFRLMAGRSYAFAAALAAGAG